jgi:ABC-type nitrate/sulfonate/bicarbonate transport system substrate-binding protein
MSAVSRKSVIAIAVVALAAAAFAAVLVVRAHAGSADGLFVLKTWTRKDCSVTPWVVAERQGFLKAEGIRVEYTGDTQPALQIPSILRGDNDVADFHPNTIAVAKAGGAAITGVAELGIEPTDPAIPATLRHMWWFVNPKTHPEVKSFSDLTKLTGKIKVATITKNICADFETKLLADKFGIPRDRIEWITMPDIQAIQALSEGLVDVSEVHPPFYKGMEEAGNVKIADSSETGLGASAGLTYWIFRDDFIKTHPQEVASFTRALRNAAQWANEHPKEAQKYTEEAIGQPVKGNHYYSTRVQVDEQLSAPWIDDLVASGVFEKGKVTPQTLVTHEIEKINAPRVSLR